MSNEEKVNCEEYLMKAIEQKNTRTLLALYQYHQQTEPDNTIVMLNTVANYLPQFLDQSIDKLSDLAALFVATPFMEEYTQVCNQIAGKMTNNPNLNWTATPRMPDIKFEEEQK